MMTLAQRLAISRNLEQVQGYFENLAVYGIDLQNFVDWLCTEGVEHYQNGTLNEGAQDWLANELLISEGWQDYLNAGLKGAGTGAVVGGLGGGLGMLGGAAAGALTNMAGLAIKNYFGDRDKNGAPISPTKPAVDPTTAQKQAATQAVSNLSKRIQQSPALQAMLGGPGEAGKLTQSLANLLQTIQNKLHEATLSPQDRLAENLAYLRQEVELKNALLDLVDQGIDPKAIFDWYVEDKLMVNENILQRVGDWWSRTKANLADAWGRWGQAGKEKQAEIDKQRDIAAMQAVVDQLAGLEAHLGSAGLKATAEFVKFAKEVKDKLGPVLGGAPAPADAGDPAADPAPVPVDQRKLQAAQNILKMHGATTLPPDEIITKIYEKSTAFIQAKNPDTATKKAWWKNVADAIKAGKDPLAAADSFGGTPPVDPAADPEKDKPAGDPAADPSAEGDTADDSSDIFPHREQHIKNLEKQILAKLGIPVGKIVLLADGILNGKPAYRWAKLVMGSGVHTGTPEAIGDVEKPENLEYLEKVAKYLVSGGPKPTPPTDAPKPAEAEAGGDSSEGVPAPMPKSADERKLELRKSVADDLLQQKKISPHLHGIMSSTSHQQIPTGSRGEEGQVIGHENTSVELDNARSYYSAVLEALGKFANGEPYVYHGNTLETPEDLTGFPGMDEDTVDWLKQYLDSHDGDVEKAKTELVKTLDEFSQKTGLKHKVESYMNPEDKYFFESICGKSPKKSTGWFSF